MNFGRCAGCREYKYLVHGTKCRSCAAPFPFADDESVLLLGDIGTGRTVTTQIAVNRFLQADGNREAFIVDLIGQHDGGVETLHSETTLMLDNSASTMNPLAAVGHISGEHAAILDTVCREAAGVNLSQNERRIVNQTAQALPQPCSIDEILVDLQSQQSSGRLQRGGHAGAVFSQLIGSAATKLSAFRAGHSLEQLGGRRDPRLNNPDPITRVRGDPSLGEAFGFAALASVYREAVESNAETLIAVDGAYKQLNGDFGRFYVDAFDSLRGGTTLWVSSLPDYTQATNLAQHADARGVLAGTTPQDVPFTVPSSCVGQLSKPPSKGHVLIERDRWEQEQVRPTPTEEQQFC